MSNAANNPVNIALIYEWPYLLYMKDVPQGVSPMIAAAVGVGAAYWWGGGFPGQGQDMMTHVTSYLVGGVAVYSYSMLTRDK